MAELIERYGYFVQHVLGDDDSLAYSYTSGLSYAREQKYAEFAMAGLDGGTMQALLNDMARAVKDGVYSPAGPDYFGKLIEKLDVGIVPIRPRSSKSFLGVPEDADAYLVVIPDAAGYFPWEAGCDPFYARQIESFDCIALPAPRHDLNAAQNAAPPGVTLN